MITSHPVIASVNLSALKHNCQIIKNSAPNSKILAVVKSNAYGHGIVPITHTLDAPNEPVDAFGVSWLNEAIKIKESGVNKPLLLLKGVITTEEMQLADDYGFGVVVHNFHQLELIEQRKSNKPIVVWLKIDSGMHRLGFQPHSVLSAYQKLINNPYVIKPLCLMTHFSDTDDLNNPKTNKQVEYFNKLVANLNGLKCLANSGAILGWKNSHADWVRSGILLYGASPLINKKGYELGFKPIMTMTTKLLTIQQLKKGDQIGYGSTWTCPEDMPVGVINAGYGDGYPRQAPNGTPVLVNGVRCPTVGRISMDMMSIDLRHCPQAQIGDQATLWGEKLPIEEIAQNSNTIAYELFCHITQRVKFQYYD